MPQGRGRGCRGECSAWAVPPHHRLRRRPVGDRGRYQAHRRRKALGGGGDRRRAAPLQVTERARPTMSCGFGSPPRGTWRRRPRGLPRPRRPASRPRGLRPAGARVPGVKQSWLIARWLDEHPGRVTVARAADRELVYPPFIGSRRGQPRDVQLSTPSTASVSDHCSRTHRPRTISRAVAASMIARRSDPRASAARASWVRTPRVKVRHREPSSTRPSTHRVAPAARGALP